MSGKGRFCLAGMPGPVAFFLIVAVAIHAPVWSGQVDFFSGPASDLVPYVRGLKVLQYQTLHQCGELPLWNPHILFGQPVAGNIQHALFYPLNLIFWIFPFFTALWISQALHMALAGWGTWLLAQRTGCGPAASLTAGALFMVNGRILYYIHAGWIGYFHAICWLPLILWSGLGILDRRGMGPPILTGVFLALCLLSGTPQYAFMAYALLALHVAVVLFRPVGPIGRLAMAGGLAWTGLVFFTLAAVQIFPSTEQAFLSTRPLGAGRSMGFHFDLDLQQWVRILIRPEFLSHDYAWELCGYIGIGGLALALLGMAAGTRFRWLSLIFGGVPVLLSLGPVVTWLDQGVRAVPGFSMLVTPSRYFSFTLLVLALSAGWGMQAILNHRKHHRWAMAGAGLCLLMAAAALIPTAGENGGAANLRLIGAAVFSVLLIFVSAGRSVRLAPVLLAAWLVADPLLLAPSLLTGYRAEALKPPDRLMSVLAAFPDPVRVAVIQPEGLRDNLCSVVTDPTFIDHGMDRVGGYEPMALMRSLRFVTRMDGTHAPDRPLWGIRPFQMARPEFYRIAGVTHLIYAEEQRHPLLALKAVDRLDRPDFHGGRWRNQPVYLYALKDPLPRTFFIPDGGTQADPVQALAHPSPNRRRLLLGDRGPGRVVLTETFHGGWQARIDGHPVAVAPFLETFLSVAVPAGARRIDLDFRPASYVAGYRITLAGGFFIILLAAYGRIRPRHTMAACRPVSGAE